MGHILKNVIKHPLVNSILRRLIIFLKNSLRRFVRFGEMVVPISGNVGIMIEEVKIKFLTHADDHFVNRVYYRGISETWELKLFKHLVKHVECFYDIGANIGIYSIYAALLNNKLKVLAFDADTYVVDKLNSNIKLNDIKNIDTFHSAIGDKTTIVNFYIPENSVNTTISSILEEQAKLFYKDLNLKKIEVQQYSLDDLIINNKLRNPDLIKLDIELNELNALRGAKNIIKTYSPNLLIEIFNDEVKTALHPTLANSIEKNYTIKIEDFLGSYGYFFFLIGINGLLKVDNLRSNPDLSNYFFTKRHAKKNFYGWNEMQEFIDEIYL